MLKTRVVAAEGLANSSAADPDFKGTSISINRSRRRLLTR